MHVHISVESHYTVKRKKKIVIWSNIQQAFICTFYLLLAPKLHYFYKYLSIVSGFCTDLPFVASSSLNIQLWHVSCTHPSLSRSERSSNHHLWSWPSWHGEHWWLCTGHAFALEVEAAWKGRNHLASTRKTCRKHGNNAIHLSYWTTNYSKQSTERKAVEKIYWLRFHRDKQGVKFYKKYITARPFSMLACPKSIES